MTLDPDATAPPTSVPRFTPRHRVAFLTIGAVLTAVTVLTILEPLRSVVWEHRLFTLLLLAAFTLTERLSYNIEVKHEAIGYSPTEISLAIGLLILNPYEFVAARVIGAGVGLLLMRKSPRYKFRFNLAHFAAETAIACALFAATRSVVGGGVLGSWFAVVTSLTLATSLGGLFVTVAIAQFDGDLRGRLLRELRTGPLLYLPAVAFAASVAIPIEIDPQLGLIAFVPAPVIWLVIRANSALRHRYDDLASVHDFSRLLGESIGLQSLSSTAVEIVRETLRAEGVALRLWTDDEGTVDAISGQRHELGEVLPKDPDDPAWARSLTSTRPLRIGELPPALSSRLTAAGFDDAFVAPIADDAGLVGVMVVAGRIGVNTSFDDDDTSRLTSLVQQLTLAARKERLQAQMQFDATHDRLTLLPNRSHFEQLVNDAGVAERTGAVLLIDLDRFKQINDTFGHQAGDTLLIEAARRIGQACVINDAVARFGGDEFAVFIPHVSADEALLIAAAISERIERSFDIESANVAVGASIGIAMMPDHGRDASDLIRCADIAMYDAKSRRTRSSLYRASLDKSDNDRSTMLNDLRDALREGQISVHFQPQIDISTRLISGAEALARWEHPTKGRIQPGDFIELAEQAGLIEELTGQVLDLACRALARWNKLGFDINVAVNISPQSLLDERLGSVVEQALRSTTIDPKRLMLEITESTMMAQDERSHRVLHSLSQLGVQVSVDDFGTGFSSLVNLRNLPVNEIKIDRSFVGSMLLEHDDEAIVRSTVELGHNLGLSVVAEGVETVDVFDRLAEFGCDIAQGFGISRPLPSDSFEKWLIQFGHQPVPVLGDQRSPQASVVGKVVDSPT